MKNLLLTLTCSAFAFFATAQEVTGGNDNPPPEQGGTGGTEEPTEPGGTEEPGEPETPPAADPWAVIVDETQPQGLTAYDVSSYVQSGLVAHFDGIRNAGANLPHDYNATTWKNLVSGQPDASVDGSGVGQCFWTDNAFYFVGGSTGARFIMNENCAAIGSQITVECAADLSLTNQTENKYQYVFTNDKDYGIYIRKNVNYKATWSGEILNTKYVSFKTDPYRNKENKRPVLSNWSSSRYVTAMVDADTKQYLFTGTNPEEGIVAIGTNPMNVPATRWMWGANRTVSHDEDNFLTAPYHSLRVYNRALSQSELEQNRRIDDMRFYGVGLCNVRLQSATAGAAGTEADGFYDVNGIHEFTRPASVTVGDAVYAPAGYQLEVWNAASNIWSFVEISPDANFTYTNCLARQSVRVTWLWEMTSGKLKLDATAYAPLGLRANYDGISNAGADVPHDMAATTWKNLVAGPDAVIQRRNDSVPINWSANGCNFLGGKTLRGYMNAPGIGFGAQMTAQIVADVDYRDQSVVANNCYPYLFASDNDFAIFYNPPSNNEPSPNLQFKTDPYTGSSYGTRPQGNMLNTHYITAMIDGKVRQRIFTGTNPDSGFITTPPGAVNIPVKRWSFGGSTKGFDHGDSQSKSHFHALRLYDRALTQNELVYNRLIDDARFHGLQSLATKGLVEIAGTAAKNASADDVIYWLKSGSVTAAAPATVECGGITYACTGYRIERVHPTYGFYETVSTGTDTTCTIEADETLNRRITWLWQAGGRLRAGNDYDVGDYVQDGLVAHYDAIRNKGADLPHDSSVNTWRNLVAGMPDGDVVKVATGSPSFTNKESAWTDTSFRFAGRATVRMYSPGVSLGKAGTIECAINADVTKQVAGKYQYYLSDTKDCGLFAKRAKSSDTVETLTFKMKGHTTTGTTDNRAKDTAWTGGRYITAQYDESGKMRLFYGTNPAVGQSTSGMYVDVINNRFTWGAGHPTNVDGDYKGDYYSLRLYNRTLTQAELERNRKIDEVRFHGAVVTNVVVTSAHEEAHGVETNGVYAVDGSWTFTAEPTVLQSGKTARPTGYTLETLTPQGWGNRTSHSGTSYTWTEGDAPVRLTWRYASGTAVFIR